MGAVQFDPKTQELTITYGGESVPWSGIDTSQPDAFISPAGLTWGNPSGSSQNGIVIDNSMRALCWELAQNITVSPYIFIGMGDLLGVTFFVYYSVTNQAAVVSTVIPFPGGTITPLTSPISVPNYVGANGCPIAPQPGTLTFKNINGVCFFSWPGLPYILQHNNQQVTILTSYLGASYLNELNGSLLAMDVWQFVPQSTNSGGGTNVLPTTGTGNATASFTGNGSTGGSNTVYSTPISQWPSTPVPANTAIELSIDFYGSANFFQGGVTWGLQFSINGGVTYNSWIQVNTTGSTGSQNINQPNSTLSIPVASGVTNLNQIFVRAFCIAAAGATGNSNGQTVYSALIASYATAPPGACALGYVQRYPYQFAWSAPQGQYGQFNPLVNGLQTGAGFNNLPDVEDTITGYFNVGPTGYILRTQGITEVSPLSSGIEPFDFNHLWASHKGIGTIYPQTVAQYGSKGAFLSDVGIFTLGYEGISTIDNKAKSAIYTELIIQDQAQFICAGLGPLQLDGNNFLAYVITAFANSYAIVTYIFNFTTNEWYRILFNSAYATTGGLQVLSIQRTYTNTSINSLFLVNYPPNGTAAEIAVLPLVTGIITSAFQNTNAAQWLFKGEEVVPGRDITIDGMYILYKAISASPVYAIEISMFSNVGEGTQIGFSLNPAYQWIFDRNWHYVLLTPNSTTPFMGKVPQLIVEIIVLPTSSSFNFQLGKAILYGSVDTEQRPV